LLVLVSRDLLPAGDVLRQDRVLRRALEQHVEVVGHEAVRMNCEVVIDGESQKLRSQRTHDAPVRQPRGTVPGAADHVIQAVAGVTDLGEGWGTSVAHGSRMSKADAVWGSGAEAPPLQESRVGSRTSRRGFSPARPGGRP